MRMTTRLTAAAAKALVAGLVVAHLAGCGSTMRAIQNRELQVEAKMSDTIFLDAEVLTGAPKIFVRAANTSDFQDLDLGQDLKTRLAAMGYTVTRNAREAQYLVTANLLYMGEKKKGMDANAITDAGVGGGVLGATVAGVTGSTLRRAVGAGLVVGAASALGEAAVGGIFHVDEYLGVVDLQIKEEVPEGMVTGTQTATSANGSNAVTETTRAIREKRQDYRSRIVVSAKQTRMDRAEAVRVIADRLGAQVAGFFKL